jgi:CBS domain-containing protein
MQTTSIVPRLCLRAETAADLTTFNPVSLREDATLAEAIVLLIDKAMHAAPVINEAGQPVGVLSSADILVHEREWAFKPQPVAARSVRVSDLMTPAVFSVPLDAPAARVVQEMVALNVSQLFVVDGSGALVGLVSALNVLRHLGA